MVKRPSILKQDDLKELDELDHDGDEGWAGKRIAFNYSGTLEWNNWVTRLFCGCLTNDSG